MSGASTSFAASLLPAAKASLGRDPKLRRSFGIGAFFGLALVAPTSHALAYDDTQSPWGGAIVRNSQIAETYNKRVMRAHVIALRAYGLVGVYAPLAAKAREIEASCGARVISGVRHTRVRGTGRWSLHASGHAVDMRGNPGCIYAHLRGWPGGYSIDYGRVQHAHISLGGREDGLRFAHGGGRRHTRLAGR